MLEAAAAGGVRRGRPGTCGIRSRPGTGAAAAAARPSSTDAAAAAAAASPPSSAYKRAPATGPATQQHNSTLSLAMAAKVSARTLQWKYELSGVCLVASSSGSSTGQRFTSSQLVPYNVMRAKTITARNVIIFRMTSYSQWRPEP